MGGVLQSFPPVNIQGTDTEILKPDGRLNYLLRRPMSFGLHGAFLRPFYDSAVASSSADRKTLGKVIKRAQLCSGMPLHPCADGGGSG